MGKTLIASLLLLTLIAPAPPARAFEVDQDLMALVAMPLAVAAVSQVTDVPVNDLMDVVALLNQAEVPPAQFVEVVRYVPVALVVEPEPQQPTFVEIIRQREQAGVTGMDLVTFIERRLSGYGLPALDLTVTQPRQIDYVTFVEQPEYVPPVVRTRIAEVRRTSILPSSAPVELRADNDRTHPHGGPPGQVKKTLGLQTGAEVVHGSVARREARHKEHHPAAAAPHAKMVETHHEKGNRGAAKRPKAIERQDNFVSRPAAQPQVQRAPQPKAHGNGKGPGGAKGHGAGNAGGHGGGHGKGKG
jgi:hypothetical protein